MEHRTLLLISFVCLWESFVLQRMPSCSIAFCSRFSLSKFFTFLLLSPSITRYFNRLFVHCGTTNSVLFEGKCNVRQLNGNAHKKQKTKIKYEVKINAHGDADLSVCTYLCPLVFIYIVVRFAFNWVFRWKLKRKPISVGVGSATVKRVCRLIVGSQKFLFVSLFFINFI